MFLTAGLAILLLVALLCHWVLVAQGRLILGPETFFVLMGASTFAVTVYATMESGRLDDPYANFIGTGLLAYLAGVAVTSVLVRFRHRRELSAFQRRPWTDDLHGLDFSVVIGVGLAALVVTVAYFYLLGYFVPFAALRGLLTQGPGHMIEVYRELRRSTSAGGTYLGLGYVSQFKNVLLPLVCLLLYFRQKVRPSLNHRLLFAVFLLVAVLGLVGTGSRFALANFGAAFIVVGVARFMAPFRLTRTQLVAIGLLFLLLLSGLTLMMGSRGQATWVDHPVLWAPLQVLDRVSIGPALERFEVYEMFLVHTKPQWGQGIMNELYNLLPGQATYTLSNRLHQLLYGNPQGNVALDVWGSLWYDFRWWGVGILFVFGGFSHLFYVVVLRGSKRFIRVITLTYAGFILGLATDLQVLILRGFLTCVLFLVIDVAVRQLRKLGDR